MEKDKIKKDNVTEDLQNKEIEMWKDLINNIKARDQTLLIRKYIVMILLWGFLFIDLILLLLSIVGRIHINFVEGFVLLFIIYVIASISA